MKNIAIMMIVLDMIIDEMINVGPVARGRDFRIVSRDNAIAHNRRVYHNKVGRENWFENPDDDGVYRRYASGQEHRNKQDGRWATERLSGHRRLNKWSRNYYPSWTDEKIRRWDKADSRFEERYGE